MVSFKIFAKEFDQSVKRDYVFLIVEVCMTCAGNDHEKFIIVLTGNDGKLLVGVASEIERMRLFSMYYHHGILDLTGTAHERKVDPWNK